MPTGVSCSLGGITQRQALQGVSSSHTRRERASRREREQVTEIPPPPSIPRESTRICVLEIKTVCLSLDPTAARSGV